jgi:hypothetical protein
LECRFRMIGRSVDVKHAQLRKLQAFVGSREPNPGLAFHDSSYHVRSHSLVIVLLISKPMTSH